MSDTPTVIGLGELLWDVFPDGRRPGGAPANVAFQANQLGCRGLVASRVGDDPSGRELVGLLTEYGLNASLIQWDSTHPTGHVTVDLSDSGHPDYVIHENVAWDFLEPDPALLAAASTASAICFGTLAQRRFASRETIHQVLARADARCQIIYDVNLRQAWFDVEWIDRSLRVSRVVKMNRDEARVLARLLELPDEDDVSLSRHLLGRYDLDLVCVTRAEAGCLMVTTDEVADVAGQPVVIVDAVGAGDAFTAALILARLQGWPLPATARFANAVGGLVASKAGAMPDLAEELSGLRLLHTP